MLYKTFFRIYILTIRVKCNNGNRLIDDSAKLFSIGL